MLVEIPESAAPFVQQVLDLLAEARTPVVVGDELALSTQQAGGIIGVPRHYMLDFAEAGKIPHRIVLGNKRVFKLSDVLRFRAEYRAGLKRELYRVRALEAEEAAKAAGMVP